MKYKSTIDRMTLEDKVALCSGADFFSTQAFEQYGIPSLKMVDGPHGVRLQVATADHLGINQSVPATCFPTASLTACSWDRDLLYKMGTAIGAEALQAGVSIVLGPGVNIKRNPLCGRNFEYFSEDPYLAGEMATRWIQGLQSQGVGASLKHFAANNQETERMSSDSILDERTLREIYLPAFEKPVKSAKPYTLMCAYNKLNATYCSDNRVLLREILRDEWGFEGVVVTDWGALNDRVTAFEAGLDLEMPGSKGFFDQEIIEAVRSGKLPVTRLDESADRLLEMIFILAENHKSGYHYDAHKHHQLARQIAEQSAVLLKNEGELLPIAKGKKIAIIGALAKEPRYQGSGSSHIQPTKLSSALDGFDALGFETTFYPGYPLKGAGDEALLVAAVEGARCCDVAVIFAGLPEEYESEGFDRASMAMPESHDTLITRVAAANPDTVVVLVGGAPVEMPWLGQVRAVLNMYLAGQAGGLAAAALLAGATNPSGKLAESYPLAYSDVPSSGLYENGGKQAQYREGIYVGYRYYDKAGKQVLFPFGHGLSYTTFEYSQMKISSPQLPAPFTLQVSLTVKNTGGIEGAEIVQLYICPIDSPVFRPEKELREFAKVLLQPGESRRVSFTLDARAFSIFDSQGHSWIVPGGVYKVCIGASSRDIRLEAQVNVLAAALTDPEIPGWYSHPAGKASQEDFESLLGRKIPPVKPWRKGEYTLECSFEDMRDSFIVRLIVKSIEKKVGRSFGGVDYDNPTFKMIMASSTGTPLKNLSQLSPDSMPRNVTAGIVHLANGRYIQGLLAFFRKLKERNI